MVQQLGAGSCVQVLQLLHRDLRLHVDDAQDKRCVLNLEDKKGAENKADEIQYFLFFTTVNTSHEKT